MSIPHRDAIDPIAAALTTIDGLDSRRGLRFVAGRMDTYLLALRQFVETYGPGLPGLDRHLAGDASVPVDQLRREVHTVGGAGALIGAAAIEHGAQAYEAARRAGRPVDELRPVLVSLQGELARLVRQLRPLVSPD